jgi:CheY-like chemotaxis protein
VGGNREQRMDRVLIVDDDVQLCSLLTERLGTEGFITPGLSPTFP